jgi:hypothetical protein
MLIATYFGAGRSASSLLDLHLLLNVLYSGKFFEERKKGLVSSKPEIFEKALLEQRLCHEILTVLESGKGHLLDLANNPDYKKDEYKEFYGEDDANSKSGLVMGNMLFNESHIHLDLKLMQQDYDAALPALQAKLFVIPPKMAADCLRMIRSVDYDDYGKFKVNPFIIPGVQLQILDYNKFQNSPNYLQDYKPNLVIMFDHNNAAIRHFQVCRMLDHPMQVNLLIGEAYLEGWLYKHREQREENTFTKLIQDISRLHGVKNRAEDRVRLDSGLKSVRQPESATLDLGLPKRTTNIDGPPVLIDKREFASDCPGLLYFNGYQTIPMVLKTGDYILFDHVAIERKVSLVLLQAFEDFKQSVFKGRLDGQLMRMSKEFQRVYVLIEFFDGHSLEELNRWLSIRRISDGISVYKNMRSSSKFKLTLAGLVQLYQERYPKVMFLYSFRQNDTLAYFKYLMKQGGSLDIQKFGAASKKVENNTKKLQEYFNEVAETQPLSSKNSSTHLPPDDPS